MIDKILNIIYPHKCIICGEISDKIICDSCDVTSCEINNDICLKCGREISHCDCGKGRYDYPIAAPFYYEDEIRDSLIRMKFTPKEYICKDYAKIIAKFVEKRYTFTKFDLIVCVPMDKIKVRRRGFNQAKVIAKELSKIMDISFYDGVTKTRNTLTQHELPRKERLANVKGAFSVRDADIFSGKTVLVIDDIATTGSTIGEVAKTVKKAGAVSVSCAVVALVKTNK